MRFKNILKNGIAGTAKQVLLIILGLVNRTVFIHALGLQYLGYTSLFSNVLTWLCFVDGGFSSVIEYRLYRAVATDDAEQIARTMKLYQRLYRFFGAVILAVGLAITGLTPFLIRTEDVPLDTLSLYKIYWLQLAAVAVGYLGSYWRAFIQAKQASYLSEGVDSAVNILGQLVQLWTLLYLKSLYWYLGIKILEVALKNLWIILIAKRKFPNALPPDTKPLPLRASGILTEIKDFLGQKISYFVYIATDNIVISRFCGIVSVAVYSNYQLILSNTRAVLFATPFLMAQSSISNFLNVESQEKQENLFQIMDFLTMVYSSALCCGYLVCFQPTITWWLGADALLPFGFIILLTVNTFVEFTAEPLYKIRATFGDFHEDRPWMVAAAVSNLFLSVVLAKFWGIIGVEVGTIAGMLCMAGGRLKFAASHCAFLKIKPYLIRHLGRTILFAAEAVAVYWLTRGIPATLPGILAKGFIAVLTSVLISILFLHRSDDARATFEFLKAKILKRF